MNAQELGNTPVYPSTNMTRLGLTLKQYYVGKALEGLATIDEPTVSFNEYAKDAVNLAEAVLEELAKEQP